MHVDTGSWTLAQVTVSKTPTHEHWLIGISTGHWLIGAGSWTLAHVRCNKSASNQNQNQQIQSEIYLRDAKNNHYSAMAA